MDTNVKQIIEYWYKTLRFPTEYDKEFYTALEKYEISPDISIDTYDLTCKDGKKNLLSMLYLCEKTKEKYKEKNIPDEILIDTLEDIVRWTKTYTEICGTLSLFELPWIAHQHRLRLIKVGRLQYCFENAKENLPQMGIAPGDNVLGVHIPAVGPLDGEECRKSLDMAREFYKKYFPEYKYDYFRCHSWLLDKKLCEVLKEDSNILKFQNMFEIVSSEPSDAILKYVFRWDMTREKLPSAVVSSGLAGRIKEKCIAGESFNEAAGFIRK